MRVPHTKIGLAVRRDGAVALIPRAWLPRMANSVENSKTYFDYGYRLRMRAGPIRSRNSLGVTISVLSKRRGKCLALPVMMKSALAAAAHSRKRLSGSSSTSISLRVGRIKRLVLSMTAKDLATCEGSSLKRGRRSIASYSARMAGETHIRIILFAARSKIVAGGPSSLRFAYTTTLVSITTFICRRAYRFSSPAGAWLARFPDRFVAW